MKWVYNIYYKIFKKEYGDACGYNMLLSLNNFIGKYNDEHDGAFIRSEIHQDGNYEIMVTTPLMKRIITCIPEAEEILFCDATSYVDRFGTKTFQLLTNSSCGGLPVALSLTSSEDEKSFVNCLKDSIQDNAFRGRRKKGPKFIMTDDDRVEQNGFVRVFPETEQLLCSFHILQCCWRYLCSSKSGISVNNRQQVFFMIKKLLYAITEEEYNNTYLVLLAMKEVSENSELHKYLLKLNDRKKKWALYFRQGKLLRGQNTNNISEAAVRVLKDRILKRTKAYSVVQLLDFLVSDMSNYYVRKIVSIANGRVPPYLASRYSFDENKLKHLKVEQISSCIYQVENEISNTSYTVDLQLNLCTCFIGKNGQICKHMKKVSLMYEKDLSLCPPKTEKERSKLLFLAMGEVYIPDQWFQPLKPTISDLTCTKETNVTVASDVLPTETAEENFEKTAELLIEQNDNSKKDFQCAIEEFQSISKKIIETVENNKDMLEPLQKFIKNFNNIKTESALQSALSTFGKYSGLSSTKRGKLCSSKRIGVQPTAIARRKVKFGGRSCLQSGRPTKRAYISEHGYSVDRNKSSLMRNFKRIAPRSITICMERNISLGKKH